MRRLANTLRVYAAAPMGPHHLTLVSAAVVLCSGASRAELAWEDIATDEQILAREGELVVVATVVTSADGTNGAPPRITFEVEETLMGTTRPGQTVLSWPSRRCDCDANTVSNPNEAIASWSATELKGPPVGSRWILVVEGQGASSRGRYLYTPEKKAWAVKILKARVKAAEAARKKAAADAARAAAAAK